MSAYVIKAVLSNAQHPEYGQLTIPFPIPNEKYDQMIERLESMRIGDALRQDCQVDKLDSYYGVLNRLVDKSVNLDELDYLAKRLDSFDEGEAEQFQAMAHKLNMVAIKDFINFIRIVGRQFRAIQIQFYTLAEMKRVRTSTSLRHWERPRSIRKPMVRARAAPAPGPPIFSRVAANS